VICAIVLAAGESRRMGCQKLLLPFGATTIIERVIDQLLHSTVDKVLVVVEDARDSVAAALAGLPVTIAANPDYQSGMLSSVRCGLRALPDHCHAVMAALGDQPGITTKLVDELVQAFTAAKKGIVVPLYRGRRGHPILFLEHYRTEILTQHDEVGLRGLLRAHAEDLFELTVSTPAVLSDMDYPEDYQRELERLRQERATHHP
jgi:molybdenum cofactor cytidylyltransferase